VVTIHDLAFLAYPERFRAARQRYLALMTRLSARRAARVIAVSAHTAREVVTRLGVAPERVVVVPNAVAEHFRPEPDPAVLAAFRAAKQLPEGYVLFVGTLEPRKNVTGLLRAFAQLAADDPTLTLVIAGGRGWLYDEIFALHEALGLQARVRFTGFVPPEELPRWYQAAIAFVYPSLYEGFGLPPLEAMACGTPVITSTAPAILEVVGAAAQTVDPLDDQALARALRAVVHDPARQAQLRAAGLARAATFTWARMARETRAVYESVLPDARHARRPTAPPV
jgi:glycosyltransferase involved in cell wall biosynthesis